jgi:hypothetical protein
MLEAKVITMPKRRPKLNKRQRQQLQRFGLPILLLLIGGLTGWFIKTLITDAIQPDNIVWAIDESVKLPSDLRYTLMRQDRCQAYRGPGTPKGVGLWGVQQISQGRLAKVVHGCSWNIEGYLMVVKDNGRWQILEAKDYFASKSNASQGSLPRCEILGKYKIDKAIEPFCISSKGQARANTIT